MIRLFEERLSIVVDIAKYKEEHQMKIHDVQREQESLHRLYKHWKNLN